MNKTFTVKFIDDGSGFLEELEENCKATGREDFGQLITDAVHLYNIIASHMRENASHLYLGQTRDSAGEVIDKRLELAAKRAPRLTIIDGGKK